ncbi:MAG TPA: autotransporter-associated beta strand repeat-containing protein [Tepidisphaeraceae bacterium]|jgi:autotransporter-associated beta strand protein|nr:autotransporter-associated beta strand repeat-containing protein [Tepidisphaeraceae bacterium]
MVRTSKMSSNMRKMQAAAVAALLMTVPAMADTYTWTPTSGDQNWNNNTHDALPGNDNNNWGTGIGGAFPNAAGDVANVNNDITNTVNLSLIVPITIGTLNLGDSAFSPTNTSAFIISGPSLTFDTGNVNTPAQINVGNVGTATNAISAPISIVQDRLLINLNPSTTAGNAQGLNITGNVTTTGKTIVISGGYKGASDTTQMTFNGGDTLIGNGTIINNSDSPMVINGNKTSFTGTIIANGQGAGTDGNTGTLSLNGGTLVNAAEMIVNGAFDLAGNNLGGRLQIGTNGSQTVPSDQRLSKNRITLNTGNMTDGGVRMDSLNGSGTLQQDTVANFDFNSGSSALTVGSHNTTGGNKLTVTTLERGAGATAIVRIVPAAGTIAQFIAANSADYVVGSNATSGTSMRVIPWMTAKSSSNNFSLEGFATYAADGTGIRPLAATEVSASFVAGANVSINSIGTLASDTSVNSLRLNNSQTSNIGSGRTLTIASGGLIFTGNNNNFGTTGGANAGTLSFGSAEGVVFTSTSATNTIGAVVTGSGGLTKGGFGTLVLTGANTYTGDTHVGGGRLQVGNGTVGSKLGDGDVTVHTSASLSILGSASDTAAGVVDVIADDAALSLLATGLFNGTVNVGASLVETVGGLYLGDQMQVGGYYGSSAAALAFPTLDVTVNDSFFTGSGVVFVDAVAVPEPGTMAVLATVGAAMLARRRR